MMKESIPVVFPTGDVLGMYLGNGHFSVTRFKRIFRNRARKVLSDRYQELHGTSIEIGRVAVRDIDRMTPRDFLLDVSCVSGGKTLWRQTFRYVFSDPGKSLRGFLVPGRRRYAE
jgi:hypothetical protein